MSIIKIPIRVYYPLIRAPHPFLSSPWNQRLKLLTEHFDCYIFQDAEYKNNLSFLENAKIMQMSGLPRFYKRFYLLFFLYKNIKRIHNEQILSFVYATSNFPFVLGFIISRIFKIPLVVDIMDPIERALMHHKQYKNYFRYVYHIILALIAKYLIRYSDLVVYTMHSSALSTLKIKKEKLLKIPQGVHWNNLEKIRRKINKEGFVLLYIGDFGRERGLKLMLDIVETLQSRIPGLKLILIGKFLEKEKKWFEKEIKRKELSNVFLMGLQHWDYAMQVVANSDVCLYPFPKRPPFVYQYPIKIIEYLALGKVVISSKLNGTMELVQDGVNGLLVEPDDLNGWCSAIYKIYKDPVLRSNIEKAACIGLEKLDWDKINEELANKLKRFILHWSAPFFIRFEK